jgi:hypothetical protein
MSCIKKGKNSRRATPDGGNGRLVPDLRRLLKDMAGKGYFCPVAAFGVFPSFTLHLSRAIGTHLHGFAADSAFFQSFFRVAS